jgi:hypothetical protein
MAAADPELRIERLEAALRMASRELQWANLTIQKKDAEIQLLQERLRKQRIGFLGPLSETLSDLQLELLTEEEPGVTSEEVEAESRREPIAAAPARKRKPHPGRKPLPESLPRVEEVIACEANCKHCGGETRVIGYDLSEVLDREPAKLPRKWYPDLGASSASNGSPRGFIFTRLRNPDLRSTATALLFLRLRRVLPFKSTLSRLSANSISLPIRCSKSKARYKVIWRPKK